MSAFVNYVADDERPSPINLAVVRVLLGSWVIWRVLSIEWHVYAEWPQHFDPSISFLHQEFLLVALPHLQWLVTGLLALFVVGYRIRWTGGLASLLLLLMLSVKSTIYLAGNVETLFVCSYLLLLFAVFDRDDVLSVDGFRRTRAHSLEELNASLKAERNSTYRARPLKWGLVVVTLMYLGATWGKVVNGSTDIWLSGQELQRNILFNQEVIGVERTVGTLVVSSGELAWLGFVGAAVVQLSLIVTVLLGWRITLPVLGLIGFHLATVATLGLYFVDMILVLSLFAAWDVGHRRFAATDADAIQIVYDERCVFCARSLQPFKQLDVNDSIRFHSQSDVPAALVDRDDVDLDAELYCVRDGDVYGGYDAFRQLFRQFRLFTPLSLLLALPPVRAIGTRVYGYVARNRSRHFVCSEA